MALDNETFELMKDSVTRFVRDRLVPAEDTVEQTNEVPEEIIQEMRDLGLFGLSIPEEYGGLGLNMEQECEVIHELCKASLTFRSVIGTTVGIGSQGLVMTGTEEQKKQYLPRLASGEIMSSFCLTEPDAGSDAASLRTVAIKDGDDYVLNGTKRFITNALRAGMLTVMARTNPDKKGASGISAFLVDPKTPGVTIAKADEKMGQRGTKTSDIIFEDARVPASALLGGAEGQGFYTAMKVLDRGRLHLSSVSTGISERIIAEALSYAAERKQFGTPIGEFQLVQAMLADSQAELFAGQAMTLDAAKKYDRKEEIAMLAACCKMFTTEAAGRIADRAVQIHGGSGYMAEYKVERFYRDVRLLRLYEGTTQIQQLVIARNMLKSLAN
ncbi:MAG: acyl-CoA dehydrogenase [Sneathiella sp.]|jgi:acyl-CoA dehydrogenase|uniref:acyl-CoA dehydrogenase family protein n=1 Tax=Sneathiella sp. TaxID=1964365 RepID=UPI000C51AB3D|nr:acyl-CoA dehydrogenase family protein [Sneathiella sp.]MAL80597.1 acyl-CoA dehydrogenase [Sneathiella sp.]|tara:strand:+ start:1213 stop:2367 length:1155 start_codon:yes stop_codon:yes gene_type:complete